MPQVLHELVRQDGLWGALRLLHSQPQTLSSFLVLVPQVLPLLTGQVHGRGVHVGAVDDGVQRTVKPSAPPHIPTTGNRCPSSTHLTCNVFLEVAATIVGADDLFTFDFSGPSNRQRSFPNVAQKHELK